MRCYFVVIDTILLSFSEMSQQPKFSWNCDTTVYLFYISSILRYNSHILQLAHVMCTVHWFLVYSV